MRKFAVLHAQLMLLAALSVSAISAAPAQDDAALPLTNLPAGVIGYFGKLKNPPLKLTLSSDGTLLAALDNAGAITLFDTLKGKRLREIETGGPCTGLVFGAGNAQLFTAGPGTDVCNWNVADGKAERKLQGATTEICAIALSPDGARLASTDQGDELRIWDIASGDTLFKLKPKHEKNDPEEAAFSDGLAWSPDGRFIVTEANDVKARSWDAVRGVELFSVPDHDGSSAAVSLAPGGVLAATTRGGGMLRLWRMDTGQIERCISGHSEYILCSAFAPDGTTILTGAADHTVRQWDVASGLELRRFSATAMSLAAAPDGSSFYTLNDDGKVLKWALTGAPESEAPEHPLPSLEEAWLMLGAADYEKRSTGVWTLLLSDADAAVRSIKSHLNDAGAGTGDEGREFATKLDAPGYAVRARAFQELQTLGTRARNVLLDALRAPHSSEVTLQANLLLSGMGLPGDGRGNLALEVLGIIHSPAAREALSAIAAQGGPAAARARAVQARMWSK